MMSRPVRVGRYRIMDAVEADLIAIARIAESPD
jgi:hypothetical protein